MFYKLWNCAVDLLRPLLDEVIQEWDDTHISF